MDWQADTGSGARFDVAYQGDLRNEGVFQDSQILIQGPKSFNDPTACAVIPDVLGEIG
jgi:hypothetical protein